MTQASIKPFTIQVRVDLRGSYLITAEDLEEVRWHAYRANSETPLPMADPLQDEMLLSTLINEMIEAKLSFYDPNLIMDDFDWDGVSWEELINAVRGLDASGEPLQPPEIPGQITIEDVLTELV